MLLSASSPPPSTLSPRLLLAPPPPQSFLSLRGIRISLLDADLVPFRSFDRRARILMVVVILMALIHGSLRFPLMGMIKVSWVLGFLLLLLLNLLILFEIEGLGYLGLPQFDWVLG